MEEILEDEGQREQYRVTAGELRQFVERYERLEAERSDLAEQMKEVMAEARARGYDVKVLKKLIALRKRDTCEVSRGGGDPRALQAGPRDELAASARPETRTPPEVSGPRPPSRPERPLPHVVGALPVSKSGPT